jgi:hypothetical protein
VWPAQARSRQLGGARADCCGGASAGVHRCNRGLERSPCLAAGRCEFAAGCALLGCACRTVTWLPSECAWRRGHSPPTPHTHSSTAARRLCDDTLLSQQQTRGHRVATTPNSKLGLSRH